MIKNLLLMICLMASLNAFADNNGGNGSEGNGGTAGKGQTKQGGEGT